MIVGLMQNKRAIEKLAHDWDILPFTKVLKDRSGGNIKIKSKETLEDGLLPVVDQGKEFIAGYTDNKDARANVNLPIIIFGDHTRILKFIDFDFAMGADGTKVLEIINDNAFPKFFYYYLRSLNIIDTGYNRHFKYIKDLVFPLPPLKTQKHIAQILDDAAALRDKTKQLLTEYDLLAQSIFLDMFGDPAINQKGWKIKSFGSVGKLDRGKSKHRPRNAPELLGGIYPLVQTGDVANSGGYIHEFKSTYSEIGLAQSKMWPKGTLCITVAANIAKTGILTMDACFPDSVVGFIPNEYTNNEFTQFWMSFLQKIIEANAPQAAQKNINLKILKELEFICPPINLQNQFAEKIDLIEKQKALAKQELKESEDLFNCLLQKAFKGELVN